MTVVLVCYFRQGDTGIRYCMSIVCIMMHAVRAAAVMAAGGVSLHIKRVSIGHRRSKTDKHVRQLL